MKKNSKPPRNKQAERAGAIYYVIGSGRGDLAGMNWDHSRAARSLPMMPARDAGGRTIHTATLALYAGDAFQICYGGTWDGQMGIGYMAGCHYCDGISEMDGLYHTAAEEQMAQVPDAEGIPVFTGAAEFGSCPDRWNIQLADGMDGIYELTLIPAAGDTERPRLHHKRLSPLPPLPATPAPRGYYLVGTFTDGEGAAVSFRVQDGVTPRLTAHGLCCTARFTAPDATVVADYDWLTEQKKPGVFAAKLVYGSEQDIQAWYGDEANYGGNYYLQAGDYTVTFDLQARTLDIRPADD